MSDRNNIVHFVKDPSLLIDLCREVIEQIDSSAEDTGITHTEAQLHEISKAIERLEKGRIAVPDALRAEKSRLVTALALYSDSTQALTLLAGELEDILNNLKSRLGRPSDGGAPKRSRIRRTVFPKTSNEVLRSHIIDVLKEFGGSGKVAAILNAIEARLDGKFRPGDLELRQDGKTVVWKSNARWERLQMITDGIIADNSPYGIWELRECHPIPLVNQDSPVEPAKQFEKSFLQSMELVFKETRNWECGDAHCSTCPYQRRGSTLRQQEYCVNWAIKRNLIS